MGGIPEVEYAKCARVLALYTGATEPQQSTRMQMRSSMPTETCATQRKGIIVGSTTSVTVSKKSYGVRYMEEQRSVLTGIVQDAINKVSQDVDRVAQERKAWEILGAVDLYDRKQRLEKELEDVEAKMAPFKGNKCTRDGYYYENRNGTALEKARVEAKDLLYPELKQLAELQQQVKIRVTMSCATDEFKEVYEWLTQELKKYKV
jgi:hypothetical protein